jgi:hypothetical protein
MTETLSSYFLIVLYPICIIFHVINAFSSLGHKGCISMIKMSKIITEFRKRYPSCSVSFVQLIVFETCILVSSLGLRRRLVKEIITKKFRKTFVLVVILFMTGSSPVK